MAQFITTQCFEVFAGENDEICWEVEAEIEFNVSGGCAPWKGSVYSCPSDVDWYGDPGDVEIENINILSVVEHDDDGSCDVELDAWEEPAVEQYVWDNYDEDDLYEAAGDQADDDYDPPEPDYDYDDCPRYYDGTGRY